MDRPQFSDTAAVLDWALNPARTRQELSAAAIDAFTEHYKLSLSCQKAADLLTLAHFLNQAYLAKWLERVHA